MKYYIFKVKDSVGEIYYVVNNMYLGYLGFDSDQIRSLLEYNANVKREYQLFAKGTVTNDKPLHKLFCDNTRLTKNEAMSLIQEYHLSSSNNKHWYKIVYPDKNSTKTELRRVKPAKTSNLFPE